jgi:cytoskeletal protein RodZ
LLTQFQQDIPDTQPQEYVEQSVESQSRKTRAVADKPVNKLRRYLPQIVIAVVAVLIIAVAYVVTFKSSQADKQAIPDTASSVTVSSKKKTSTSKKSSSESSSTADKTSSASKKKTKKSSSSKKASSKLSVAVAAEANSAQAVTVKNWPTTANTITVGASKSAAWVEVLINGTATWQGTLSAGADHTVDLPAGTTSFAVKSGNATTTTIKLNKTNVDISSGTSFVRTINFTTESAGN